MKMRIETGRYKLDITTEDNGPGAQIVVLAGENEDFLANYYIDRSQQSYARMDTLFAGIETFSKQFITTILATRGASVDKRS